MNILFDNEENVGELLLSKMTDAALYAMELEELPEDRVEISVSFVSLEEIHELNREYRNVDRPTDVLSFPQFERDEEIPEVGPVYLGDVVISTDKAKAQAEEYGHSYERELVYLFTHSVLHLLGYDHMEEDEKKEMREREEEIMSHLGIFR